MSFANRDKLEQILKCPECSSKIIREGDSIKCSSCAQKVSEFEGALVFHTENLPENFYNPEYRSSNTYTKGSLEVIDRYQDGIILDLGAGSASFNFPNVVQLEMRKYAGTDIVVSHKILPFKDNSFDAVISQAVLEHVEDPFHHVMEIWRVLKKGGEVVLDSAFLQPLHGAPQHYFNTTHYAIELLFNQFEIKDLSVGPHQHPWYMLRWVLRSYLRGLQNEKDREIFRDLTVREIEERFHKAEIRGEEAINRNRKDAHLMADWDREQYQINEDILSPFLPLTESAIFELAAGFHIVAKKTLKPKPWNRTEPLQISMNKDALATKRPKKSLFKKSKEDDVLRIDQNNFNSHAGEIYGKRKVRQSFSVDGRISRIDVMFATFMRYNNRDVHFILRDDLYEGEDLVHEVINASYIKDNSYFSFEFKPVQSKLGAKYFVIFESPDSDKSNCVTVRTSDTKLLDEGELYIDGVKEPRDLTFKVYTRIKVQV